MYFTVVTDAGARKMMEALERGEKLNITEFAVGDGGGGHYSPSAGETALRNEIWRGAVNSCHASGEAGGGLIIESMIPSSVGGFTIREMGVFDSGGTLIAVCSTPDTRKAMLSEGAVHELVLSMELALSNADGVELTADPTVVTATKKDIDGLRAEMVQKDNALAGRLDAYLDNIGDLRAEMVQQGIDITDDLNAHLDETVRQAVAGVYRFRGSIDFAELPAEGLVTGDTYNIRDGFTTTDIFAEGAGRDCPPGTNITYNGGGWDCLGGIYDFSAFAMKTELEGMRGEMGSGLTAANAGINTVKADLSTARNDITALRGVTLTATLAANATSVSFTNAAITSTAIIDIYTDKYGVNPTAATITGTTLKLTFDAQTAAVNVMVTVRRGV